MDQVTGPTVQTGVLPLTWLNCFFDFCRLECSSPQPSSVGHGRIRSNDTKIVSCPLLRS